MNCTLKSRYFYISSCFLLLLFFNYYYSDVCIWTHHRNDGKQSGEQINPFSGEDSESLPSTSRHGGGRGVGASSDVQGGAARLWRSLPPLAAPDSQSRLRHAPNEASQTLPVSLSRTQLNWSKSLTSRSRPSLEAALTQPNKWNEWPPAVRFQLRVMTSACESFVPIFQFIVWMYVYWDSGFLSPPRVTHSEEAIYRRFNSCCKNRNLNIVESVVFRHKRSFL